MREKREKDESHEVFATIDKDRYVKHNKIEYLVCSWWTVVHPQGTVLLAEKILPTLWYLWDSKAQTNRWAFKTLGLANSYQDWFQISFLSPTVHHNRRILCTQQLFARFQLWWMLLEEIPKFHWWIFKMPPAVFSANHNKCDRLSWYHWYHW